MLVALAVAAALTTVNVPDTLGSDVDKASDKSGIAVLLPETIDTEADRVHGNLLPSSDGRYGLTLGFTSSCVGQSVCGIANFYGTEGVKPNGGKKVKLAKGRKGHFYKSACGANCTFPSIAWSQGGVLYTIEFKEAGSAKDLKPLANSAIQAGPR